MRGWLAGHPRTGDAVLVTDELATNAILHTPAGHPQGTFIVRAYTHEGRLRIAITTPPSPGPSPWAPADAVPAGLYDDHGRGLTLVYGFADDVGSDDADTGVTIWADFDWNETAR